VTALNSKRNIFVFVHPNACHRSRRLFLEGLDYVLGLGVFYLAIDLTKTATNAGFLVDIYPFHSNR
jgi:hypothetical protein